METTTKLLKQYKEYIISCIDDPDDVNFINKSDDEKIEFLSNRFDQEYKWRVDQVGSIDALTEWLQGLSMDILFYNHDIVQQYLDFKGSSRCIQDLYENDNILYFEIISLYWKVLPLILEDLFFDNTLKTLHKINDLIKKQYPQFSNY